MAHEIELVPVSQLIPYARNARTHSEAQVAQIARSIEEFGFTNPVLTNGKRGILAGHGRVLAAQRLGLKVVPCVSLAHLDETQQRAYILADNRLPLNAGWDEARLGVELADLRGAGVQLELLGFEAAEIAALLDPPTARTVPEPEPPEVGARVISRAGDVWILGRSRLGCGDSTVADDVARVVPAGTRAPMLHADPPYGMGKESEGVANDNLYNAKLDAFQMAWWRTWRPFLADNASAYIWGVAEDLWRLWFAGGLSASERMTFRNEVVWDKGNGMGMLSDTHRQFATATERCLFFMLGQQAFGNVNLADYWEGFEPIRGYLAEQCEAMGWRAADIKRLCGVGMFAHWFTKSQWVMIPERHYNTLQAAAEGRAFTRPYAEVRALYDGGLAHGGHLAAKQEFYGTRAYFDNLHDAMTDVWQAARVTGEERFGHATPKPLPLIARCVVSSSPEGGEVLEPFAGTGTTILAAELRGRACYALELAPEFVDVAVRRWEKATSRAAVLEGDGRTFEEVARARADG